ncbi:hypothetical protein [Virgibacillus siamensis]|uniref:hypothetical protein n=1 Tax=Virgibacillus siamensis TaxID=480071 RepID=UPI0009872C97|nr:hypothetical protein [Virgibacillus siamensis]
MLSKNHIKEVILHVGWSKTGTSSIQSTLYDENNNKLLLNEGILYPTCWQSNHGVALCSAFSPDPGKYAVNKFPKVLSKDEIEKKDRFNLKKFEETVNNSSAKKLVISGEGILPLPNESINNLKKYLREIGLKKAKFKILIYTRNPVSWTGSTLQQRFKDGFRYAPAMDKLKNQTLPTLFQDKIGKFIDIFGKKAVHVYSFEEARTHDNGMVGHFLEQLNADKETAEKMKEIRKNDGMSMFTGEFLKYINGNVPLFKNGKPNKKRHRRDHQPLLTLPGDKFDLPMQTKKEISLIVQNDLKWLKNKYHIDYLHEEIKEKNNYENVDKTFDAIEKIYPTLTKTIRNSIVDFMENKLLPEIPSDQKDYCLELIRKFKELEEDLTRTDHIENRFLSTLKINDIDRGVLYRELALLMETYDQIELAELFMRKASLYKTNVGPLIKEKHKEYKEKLQQN